MKHRPFSELTEQLSTYVNNRWDKLTRKPLSHGEFISLTDKLTNDIYSHVTSKSGNVVDIKEHKGDWTARLNEIRKNYSQLSKLLEDYKNQEKIIHRIEKKAQNRALFYRVFNTLLIGFGIMLVYFVAQKLDIMMPFMRLPI